MRISLPIIILFLAVSSWSQAKPEPYLIADIGQSNCETLLVQVDNFYLVLNKTPKARGIVVFSGAREFLLRKLNFEMLFDGALEWRGLDPSRTTKIRSVQEGEIRVELWVVPPGATWSQIESVQWDLKLPAGTKPFILHTDMEQICSTPTFPKTYKELLDANPDARGHIVVYALSRKLYTKGVNEAKSKLKNIDPARLRFFFEKTNSFYSSADYWIVPKRRR